MHYSQQIIQLLSPVLIDGWTSLQYNWSIKSKRTKTHMFVNSTRQFLYLW